MNRSSNIIARQLALAAAAAALALSGAAQAQKLPATMAWSSYDVGSAGYAEASAIADAFGKKFGTKVRIQPSGSSIGRLQPVVQKRADYGFLATETFFATEGTYDFSARRWGPQDLRVVLARPSSIGMPTAADANIRKLEDVKGKRVAYVAGNPSVNAKCDAFLAFAGLTHKDIDLIMFPTYAAAMSSLAQGKADATCTTTTPSQMYELQSSPRGIHWVDIPADNKKGWDRIRRVAPFMGPYKETVGAGISAEKPAHIVFYRYPVLVSRADKSADEVYAFIKALDETYDLYKNATAVMPRWSLQQAGTSPADAPFHEGAIRYLKEKGVWNSEHQAWNDDRLKRLNALRAAWVKAEAEGKGKSDEEFAAIWEKRRNQVIESL
jgi:TRAP transporter TAXI family solute receptor